jgi:hypothetical protein
MRVEAAIRVGLLKEPKQPGLVTESRRPTILHKIFRKRPENKQWVAMKREMGRELASGYRGAKKWFKEVTELGD